MPLKLKVVTDGKTTTYERKEDPMLENLLDALKVQRAETAMYSDPKAQPTEAQLTSHMKLLAEFAANFWGNGLSAKDVLTGVSAKDGFEQISQAVAVTLGMSDDEEDDDDTKKSGKAPKK